MALHWVPRFPQVKYIFGIIPQKWRQADPQRQAQEPAKCHWPDTKLSALPTEVLDMVVAFMDISSLLPFALACRYCHQLVLPRLSAVVLVTPTSLGAILDQMDGRDPHFQRIWRIQIGGPLSLFESNEPLRASLHRFINKVPSLPALQELSMIEPCYSRGWTDINTVGSAFGDKLRRLEVRVVTPCDSGILTVKLLFFRPVFVTYQYL